MDPADALYAVPDVSNSQGSSGAENQNAIPSFNDSGSGRGSRSGATASATNSLGSRVASSHFQSTDEEGRVGASSSSHFQSTDEEGTLTRGKSTDDDVELVGAVGLGTDATVDLREGAHAQGGGI